MASELVGRLVRSTRALEREIGAASAMSASANTITLSSDALEALAQVRDGAVLKERLLVIRGDALQAAEPSDQSESGQSSDAERHFVADASNSECNDAAGRFDQRAVGDRRRIEARRRPRADMKRHRPEASSLLGSAMAEWKESADATAEASSEAMMADAADRRAREQFFQRAQEEELARALTAKRRAAAATRIPDGGVPDSA